jgi:ribosome recycling factor
MIEDVKKSAEGRMAKSVDALKHELAKLRTGRANASLLDHIRVSYYGSEVPLTQVANVTAADARSLIVTPWDKNMVNPVEKAIRDADLGLNPVTAGTVIRVPVPPLTEERRRELVRVVHKEVEAARVAVRNVRRDANAELKQLLKDKLLSEDDERRGQEQVQKLTDRFIAEVDKILEAKEKELLTF